jgi:hypothetical protein
MFRQLSDMEDRARNEGKSDSEIYHMLDGLLTNYISDLKKTDREYQTKWVYFHPFLESGHFPDALETFERKGHGKIHILGRRLEQDIAASQAYEGRVLPPYMSNGGKKKTSKHRHRKSQKTRRHRRH